VFEADFSSLIHNPNMLNFLGNPDLEGNVAVFYRWGKASERNAMEISTP